MLEARTNTQSLILLFSPSVPGGRWICNLHWLYKTSLDKMKTLRENAYAKCEPSGISELLFQLLEARVSTLWGSDVQPVPLVHLCHGAFGVTQPTGAAGDCRQRLVMLPVLPATSPCDAACTAHCISLQCCPLHPSYCGSPRIPFPPLPHLCKRRDKC